MLRNVIIVLLAFGVIGCEKKGEPVAEPDMTVKESFDSLKSKLRNGNGKEAVSFVAPSTLDMYEKCRKLALDSGGVDFETLSQMEVLLTLRLRFSLTREKLESMNGSDIFIWGVDEGLVDKSSIEKIELDKVQREGERAFVTLINNGQPVDGGLFKFELHENKWKLDMMAILEGVEVVFDGMRKQTGKTKIELAVFLIERSDGKEVPVQILKGPLK